MFWNKKKVVEEPIETRSFTSQVSGNIENEAVGNTAGARLSQAAIREICSGIYGRAFASADVSPVGLQPALTPAVLEAIGRSFITAGESVFEIVVNGTLRLRPCSTWDIDGNPDPDSWVYKLELSGPSKTISKSVPGSQVVHCRYGASQDTPWQGCSPLDSSITKQLVGNLEYRIMQESATPTGYLLPLPQSANTEELRADLGNIQGGLLTVESTSTNWEGGGRRPANDWEVQRLGAQFDGQQVTLRRDINYTLLASCGLSPIFLNPEGTGALREAYRIFLHATLSPVAKLVSSELSEKLEQEVTLSFQSLFAADVQGRARAYRSLVDAQMPPGDAAKIVGLED